MLERTSARSPAALLTFGAVSYGQLQDPPIVLPDCALGMVKGIVSR
jgi:hypothetical protein